MSMKRNNDINYITYDSWWDTDKTILPEISNIYNVNTYVLDFMDSELKFKNKESYNTNLTIIKQNYRDRNILSLFAALKLIFKVIPSLWKKNVTNIFVPGKNIYLVLLLIFCCPKRNTIICIHNYIEHVDRRGKIGVFIKKLYINKFRKFLFYSHQQQLLFKKEHPLKASFFINMPLKDFGNPTEKRKYEEITFLFFGLIRDYKRLDLFINAANQIEEKKVKFVIAGNTKNWGKYESMIKDQSKYICDIRYIADSDVPNYFCNADFLVLPYEDATQSGPSLIALNYGLPIIASDLSVFRDIITDGENGFLFKTGDIKSLISILKHSSSLTNEELQKMKIAQRKKRELYQKKCNLKSNLPYIIKS